jgi:nucleoid DNA-binding protein
LTKRGELVTKKDLARAIAEETGLTQTQAKEIVQGVFDGIVETLLAEGRIELRNFGVFEVRRRKSRKARNPRTGDKVKVPAKLVVTFKITPVEPTACDPNTLLWPDYAPAMPSRALFAAFSPHARDWNCERPGPASPALSAPPPSRRLPRSRPLEAPRPAPPAGPGRTPARQRRVPPPE